MEMPISNIFRHILYSYKVKIISVWQSGPYPALKCNNIFLSCQRVKVDIYFDIAALPNCHLAANKYSVLIQIDFDTYHFGPSWRFFLAIY